MRVADLNNENQSDKAALTRGPLFYVGAGALLIVMAVETVAVIGRHIGWPLLGAIEIIQAAILIAACAATVAATLNQAHATVHLLVDRLPLNVKQWLLRFDLLLSALFFAGLTAATVWLAVDFWNAYEESELLHISYRPLRAVTALATAAIAIIFLNRAVRHFGTKR
jgi:TRAP-type C4-dicarboxylate transport system permease small subunit